MTWVLFRRRVMIWFTDRYSIACSLIMSFQMTTTSLLSPKSQVLARSLVFFLTSSIHLPKQSTWTRNEAESLSSNPNPREKPKSRPRSRPNQSPRRSPQLPQKRNLDLHLLSYFPLKKNKSPLPRRKLFPKSPKLPRRKNLLLHLKYLLPTESSRESE